MNNFLPILDSWGDYYQNPYEGLGTTYERFILHKLFKSIDLHFHIESILESPSFGMTGISGINSVWWSKAGKKVVLTDTDQDRINQIKRVWQNLNYPVEIVFCPNENLPFKSATVDLAWNFAALWFLSDIKDFAAQLKIIAKKVIFICVPNNQGLGYLLRKAFTNVPATINLNNINSSQIRKTFSGDGWELWDEGIFDVPPWPDIPMKKEDLLQKMHLGILLKIMAKNSQPQMGISQPTILDYYGNKNSAMEKDVLRYDFLEKYPKLLKIFWGHHRYFIFKKTQ